MSALEEGPQGNLSAVLAMSLVKAPLGNTFDHYCSLCHQISLANEAEAGVGTPLYSEVPCLGSRTEVGGRGPCMVRPNASRVIV